MFLLNRLNFLLSIVVFFVVAIAGVFFSVVIFCVEASEEKKKQEESIEVEEEEVTQRSETEGKIKEDFAVAEKSLQSFRFSTCWMET